MGSVEHAMSVQVGHTAAGKICYLDPPGSTWIDGWLGLLGLPEA